MLRHLRVGNLALARDVALELGPGLTMLTGETGAGKSLIAGALALLAGAKADRGLVREGEELAWVEGVFDLSDRPGLRREARRAGLQTGEDGLLVLRRELRREGRGRVLINGLVSSVALLERMGGRLVAVQSQDERRQLERPHFAADFLDTVLGLQKERRAVRAARAAWQEAAASLAARADEAARAREQREMWAYQHRELEAAALDGDEAAALREQIALGRGARGLLEAAAAARQEVAEGEPSAVALLGAAAGRLAAGAEASERLAEVVQLLVAAQEQAADAARLLERFLNGVELDPARLDEMEARLALYDELRRKHDRDVPGLLALQEELAVRLARHDAAEADLAALAAARDAAEKALAESCARLRARRRAGAPEVARRAEALVRPLALPSLELAFAVEPATADDEAGAVTVEGEPCRVTARGADRVTLAARINPGEGAGDVARIASGGERSRLFLGLTVLARAARAETPLQLFDEVDAGLGMDHAVGVARLLAEVADGGQVLCITHLPVVAACGERHLLVAKEVREGRTSVAVRPLRGEARVQELARLLGGEEAGDPQRRVAYARDLLRGGAARAARA